jgi:hypothetical protein
LETALKTAERQVHELAHGAIRYDAKRRRVWVCGQRLHHGLTGLFLAGAGMALMAHDWHDRSIWFDRIDSQP